MISRYLHVEFYAGLTLRFVHTGNPREKSQ